MPWLLSFDCSDRDQICHSGSKGKALLSVSNKQDLAKVAEGLLQLGYELVSTGGSARSLQQSGLKVTQVDELTGFPEMLDGKHQSCDNAVYDSLGFCIALHWGTELTELHEMGPFIYGAIKASSCHEISVH